MQPHLLKLQKPRTLFRSMSACLCFLLVPMGSALGQSTFYWGGGTNDIADGTAIVTNWTSLEGTWGPSTQNFATDTGGTTYQAWSNGGIFSGTFMGYSSNTTTEIAYITNTADFSLSGLSVNVAVAAGSGNKWVSFVADEARTITLLEGAVIDVRGAGTNLASLTPGLNTGLTINRVGTNVSLVGSDGFTKTGNYVFQLFGNHDGLTGTVNILHNANVASGNAAGTVLLGSGTTANGSLAGITRFNVSASGFFGGSATDFGTIGRLGVYGNSNNQLNDAAVIELAGLGIFLFNDSAGTTETVGSLRLASAGILDLGDSGNGGTLLFSDGIDRAHDRAQLSVRLTSGGTNGTAVNLGSHHGLGTGVLLPWLTDATKARFGMIDASNNLAWVAPTDVTGNVNSITDLNANYRIVGNAASFGANTNLASGAAAHTLAFYRSNSSGPVTVRITDTLTVGGGGIVAANDNQNLDVTLEGTNGTSLTTGSNTPLYLASGFGGNSGQQGTLNINAPITGTMDVIKGGYGTVKFGGTNQANTYTGTTYVNSGVLALGKSSGTNAIAGNVVIRNGGTLQLDNRDQIADTSTVTIESGGYFNTLARNETIANLAGAGMLVSTVTAFTNSLTVNSSVTPGDGGIGSLILNLGSTGGTNSFFRMNTNAVFNMELSAAGGTPDRVDFYNYDSGEFILAGSNAINLSLVGAQTDGRYTVSLFRFFNDNGTTAANSGLTAGLTIGTTGTIIGAPTLNFNAGGSTIDITYNVGAMFYTDGGTVTLSGAQNYDAATFIRNATTLNANTLGALPATTTTALVMDDTGSGGSTLNLGANQTVSSLAGAATSTIGLGAHTLAVNGSSSTTFAGTITGSGNLTKQGNNTLTLAGSSANTFSGATFIGEGVLELGKTAGVDAIAGSTLDVSKVDNANRATLLLSASNQVSDSTAITLSGGTIRRASGVSEVFGNLTLASDSFLDFGSGTAGSLAFGTYAPSSLLTVNNFFAGNTLTFGSDLTGLIAASSSGPYTGTYFSFDQGFTTSYSEEGSFTITAIPEPSTYFAMAGLLAVFLWPTRRRLIKDIKSILGRRRPAGDRLASYR